jgi:iron-sulfur cluster assembly protein/iron-sulfur cluster insertion protein
MVTLTNRAADKIRSLLSQHAGSNRGLRVFVEAGGCSGLQYGMGFAEPMADDVALESEGVRFYMDPASLEYMKGSVIDFDDGLTGKGFEIRNPNAQQTCGCGKSFN